VLKLGVTELAPLTFRATTLGLAALGLLVIAKLSGAAIRLPRALWLRVAALALFNITGWSALIVFGVQLLPAGRSAILAYTLPIWSVLFSLWLLHEPLSSRKLVGLLVGMGGMAILLGEDIVNRRGDLLGLRHRAAAALVAVRAADHADRLDDAAGMDSSSGGSAAARPSRALLARFDVREGVVRGDL